MISNEYCNVRLTNISFAFSVLEGCAGVVVYLFTLYYYDASGEILWCLPYL